jgi:hypothetical protein
MAQAYVDLLNAHSPADERDQLWTGVWRGTHRAALWPHMRLCTPSDARAVLLSLGRLTVAAVEDL